ncbi:glutamine--tRNA ligase/YqeY domain fusion protein [Vicingus serpentipes]|uniref:Glutamine--tRNA ligase n=1 Tax=Vicingus serpentipes TaxID=1926625 RepID=A0A5C6RXK6_9FLAO|nr:glutamine--tRNA ligase/YqeY domain fusion protein [Vicingus serpentipes]TXB67088.1 glutamine--tRNA ligase/YqeY domain fusion protein [Vicingus serpentipes]
MENHKEEKRSLNFIEQIIEEDLREGFSSDKLKFRFPPEPNGYLHIGHAKAFCLNFGLGAKYNAPVNLRFDDTNPSKEEQEFVDAIKYDLDWMGLKWDEECYSSDYFQQLYDWALSMIKNGKAYVDSQSSEAMATQKGTPTVPGTDSPYRDRSVEENLDLFNRMKQGEFKEGEHILRAKIDMKHTNMLMRDPIMYRVMHKSHHRTGNDWCIYPMYDWTHGESDYLEQISHSLCSLEFKAHRELYDWFLDQVHDETKVRPKQREFSRLNLNYTVMSKRKLMQLVEDKIVNGWDDPRMPTISGLRRRGYTPASIHKFIDVAGVSKREQMIDVALLESCVRADLNKTTNRIMAVLNPLKLVLTNYPEGKTEIVMAENNPEDENAGHREMIFSREIYIERDDFLEQCPNKIFKLGIGKEVRLKHGYIINGVEAIKDADGNVIEVLCTYDEKSKSGSGTEESNRKVKGTVHWVSASHNVKAQVNAYDRLFTVESPDGEKEVDFKSHINPDSLTIIKDCIIELALKDAKPQERYQFQRIGYFCVDNDSTSENLIFNRTATLKDGWAKKPN